MEGKEEMNVLVRGMNKGDMNKKTKKEEEEERAARMVQMMMNKKDVLAWLHLPLPLQ